MTEALSIPRQFREIENGFTRSHHFHQLELKFDFSYDNERGSILIQVLDHRDGINRFQAFLPDFPMPKNNPYVLEGLCGLLDMFKVVFLYAPAVVLRNVSEDDPKIDLKYQGHEFLYFILMHYYSVCKYEYGYDYGIPCEAGWPDNLCRTLYPLTTSEPLLTKETFDQRVCLAFSGGKESTFALHMLHNLKLCFNIFRMHDVGRQNLTTELLEKDSNIANCIHGQIQLTPTFHLDRLGMRYDHLPYSSKDIPVQVEFGLSAWIPFVRNLLILLFGELHKYDYMLVGSELECLQTFRIPKGLYPGLRYGQSQACFNYMDTLRNIHTTRIVSPIVNFSRGFIMNYLETNHIPYNSCPFNAGEIENWCGKCVKCRAVIQIIEHLRCSYLKEPFSDHSLVRIKEKFGIDTSHSFTNTLLPTVGEPTMISVHKYIMDHDHIPYFTLPFTKLPLNIWPRETLEEIVSGLEITQCRTADWKGSACDG